MIHTLELNIPTTIEPESPANLEPLFQVALEVCKDLVDLGAIHFSLDENTLAPSPIETPAIQDLISEATKAIYYGLVQHINVHRPNKEDTV